jgi:isopenicillin N synthase-like dioxygenase
MTDHATTSRYAAAVTSILDRGYARCQLIPPHRNALDHLRSAAGEFFAADLEWKCLFSGDGYGYEGYGNRWGSPDTDDPAQRDECERLDSWAAHPLPNAHRMPALEAALGRWRQAASQIAGDVLDSVAANYGQRRDWDFRPTSWVEVSCYGTPSNRELLITPHTDGQLITVLATGAPGLEAETGGVMTSIPANLDEVIIFPGELMAAMTDGQIRPLNHQVRNQRVPMRLSVMYFTSAPFAGYVAPFAGTANDISAQALKRCTAFGQHLPADLLP